MNENVQAVFVMMNYEEMKYWYARVGREVYKFRMDK